MRRRFTFLSAFMAILAVALLGVAGSQTAQADAPPSGSTLPAGTYHLQDTTFGGNVNGGYLRTEPDPRQNGFWRPSHWPYTDPADGGCINMSGYYSCSGGGGGNVYLYTFCPNPYFDPTEPDSDQNPRWCFVKYLQNADGSITMAGGGFASYAGP